MKLSQKHILLAALLSVIPLFCSGEASSPAKKQLALKTVCIDPGHGGKDAGCVSKDKKTYEKDIVLSIGKSLSEKIKAAYPDVKVIMTRSDDTFIPLEERASKATRAGADLFISIHINASDKSTAANGFSIHTLGQSRNKNRDLFKNNMELCKRENSAILLEDDYSTRYQGFNPNDTESYIIFNLMQNSNLEQSLSFAEDVDNAMKAGPVRTNRGVSQDPFLVLWKTTMPAVLIECAFISNATDLNVLRSSEGRDKIAENIFSAFSTYKKRYDSSLSIQADASEGSSEAPSAASAKADVNELDTSAAASFGTQVLATSRKMDSNDKFFKGYQVLSIFTGKLYKYFVGCSSSLEEARKINQKAKNDFPDSFLVEIKSDSSVTRIQ